MMTVKQFYLMKLAEECAEVAQRALKQMQFGKNETQASGPSLNKDGDAALTNDQRLLKELIDLLAVVGVLVELGEIPDITSEDAAQRMEEKRKKLAKYLRWSQECGQVEDPDNKDID